MSRFPTSLLAVVAAFSWMSACEPAPDLAPVDYGGEVAAIAEAAWQILLSESPFMQSRQGLLVTELPDNTEEKMQELAAKERALIERIDAVPAAEIDHEDLLTLQLIRWSAEQAVEFETHWWLDFDITPYTGGMALNFLHQVYLIHPFDDAEIPPRKLFEPASRIRRFGRPAPRQGAGANRARNRLAKSSSAGAIGVWRSFRQGASEIFTVG